MAIILESVVLDHMEKLNMASVLFGNKQQGKLNTNKNSMFCNILVQIPFCLANTDLTFLRNKKQAKDFKP